MEHLFRAQYLKSCQTPHPNTQLQTLPQPPHSPQTALNPPQPSTKFQKNQHSTRIYRDKFANGFQSLTSKYFIEIDEQELHQLVQKAVKLKSTLLNSRFEQVFVAAVFYYFYSEKIGIYKTKYFCRRNSLRTKRFNRNLLACHFFFQNQNLCFKTQIDTISCSESDHEEEDSKKETNGQDGSQYNMPIRKTEKVKENMSPLEAIDLIYDFVFKSQVFQNSRREIILKMVEKYEKTNPAIIQAIDWTDHPLLKIYHIVVYYFKKFGAPCCVADVRKIIFLKLGLDFTIEGYKEMIKVFNKFDKLAQEQNDQ